MDSAIFVVFDALKEHQRGDAKEYFRLTALDLLLKHIVLFAKTFDVPAEFYYLFFASRFDQVLLALAPGVLVDLH